MKNNIRNFSNSLENKIENLINSLKFTNDLEKLEFKNDLNTIIKNTINLENISFTQFNILDNKGLKYNKEIKGNKVFIKIFNENNLLLEFEKEIY